MISDVDTFIMTRLAKIKMGSNPIKLYAPDEQRPKGEFTPPCYAVDRYTPWRLDTSKIRTFCETRTEYRTGSIGTNVNANMDAIDGSNEPAIDEGTLLFEKRPYPTPIKLYYQVDILAANKTDYKAMVGAILSAFPPRYMAVVSGRHVYFNMEGDPQNLSELANPLFRTAVRYEVSDVMIQRQERKIVPAITDIRVNTGIQEN